MACSIPPQLESTLRIFTQDWYPSSPPPSRPGYSVCPAPTDAGCPPRILKLSPKESGLQNQADPAPPATRHCPYDLSHHLKSLTLVQAGDLSRRSVCLIDFWMVLPRISQVPQVQFLLNGTHRHLF
nr:uncharacterized protein LOC123285324 isoform X1 [Equus asinus]